MNRVDPFEFIFVVVNIEPFDEQAVVVNVENVLNGKVIAQVIEGSNLFTSKIEFKLNFSYNFSSFSGYARPKIFSASSAETNS